MSNTPIDKELDDALQRHLQGDSEYSARYAQLSADDVPAELDRAVLAHAAQHVARKPKPLAFWMRMSAPVAIAASVVLVLSIVIQSNVSTPVTVRMEAAPSESVAVPADAPANVETTSDTTSMEDRRTDMTTAMATQEQRQTAATEATERAKKESAMSTVEEKVVATSDAIRTAKPPAPAASMSREQEAVAVPAETIASAPMVAAPPAQPAAPASAAPVARTAAQENATTDLQEIVVTGTKRRSSPAAGPRGTVQPASSYREPSDAELAKQYRESNPERWLTHIRELRAQNKHRDADREWRNFVKAYPQHLVAHDDPARPKP